MNYDLDYVKNYYEMMKDFDNHFVTDYVKGKLKPECRILELGSGTGSDYKILRRKFHHIVPSDYSDAFIAEYKRRHNEKFIKLDAITLTIDQRFDCIYSSKVLNSLSIDNLSKSIKRQAEILTVNGAIIHTLWCGNPNIDESFIPYDTLVAIFEKYFNIVEITKYKEADYTDADYDSVIIYAKKKANLDKKGVIHRM